MPMYYEPEIGVGTFQLLFLYTIYPLIKKLPDDIWCKITRYLFPKGFYVLYTGIWYRLDDKELPEWVKRSVWQEIFKDSKNPF